MLFSKRLVFCQRHGPLAMLRYESLVLYMMFFQPPGASVSYVDGSVSSAFPSPCSFNSESISSALHSLW